MDSKELYQKEKAYVTRRAEELTAEMVAALDTGDPVRFRDAYTKSARYMRQRDRKPLYIRFLQMLSERRATNV